MTNAKRQPAIYLSHGGGPCFWMEFPEPFGAHAFDSLRAYLANLLSTLPERPKAILVISAHWEARLPTLGINPSPPMVFDYYGFPEHTYELDYPAPGAPDIAAKAQILLENAGIATATESERGFDHGVFVPFLIMDPDASIPVATLSLQAGLDPATHIAIGAALAPLRDEGVLIIGSGNSYHNLEEFFDGELHDSKIFDEWLNTAITNPYPAARNNKLIDWENAPSARECHPREEHLLPLMVVSGAGAKDPAKRTFNEYLGGKLISCFQFG